MFDSICIQHNQDTGSPLDLGFLAEALLYYQHVHVSGDRASLTFLARTCGPELLLDLLQSKLLTLDYWENFAGVMSHARPGFPDRHRFQIADMPHAHLQHVAPKLLQDLVGKSGKGRRLANRLMSFVVSKSLDPTVHDQAAIDFADGNYVRDAVGEVLRGLVPEYELPSPFVFEVFQEKLMAGSAPPDPAMFDANPERPYFRIESNIDFGRANELLHRRVLATELSITPGYLLAFLFRTRVDVLISSVKVADMALSPTRSAVAQLKFKSLMNRTIKHEEQIEIFQDFVLQDGRAIREAVNSGAKNFADVMTLLEAAEQFKRWIRDQPEDEDLRKAYCHDIARVSWADKLPSRTTRWAIFAAANTALGLLTTPVAGVVGGLALSTLDSFLVDKIIKGWRPSQFIEGPLRTFTST
jgi:hypothetical protein